MQIQRRFQSRAAEFSILAFHDTEAKTFAQLDPEMRDLSAAVWDGKELPFPILLDASGTTLEAFGVEGFPTTLLIDPQGTVVAGTRADERLVEELERSDPAIKSSLAKAEKNLAALGKAAVEKRGDDEALLLRFARSAATPAQLVQLAPILAKLGGDGALELLQGDRGARHADAKVRAAAAKALGDVTELGRRGAYGGPAESELRHVLRVLLLADPDAAVKKAAQSALDVRTRRK